MIFPLTGHLDSHWETLQTHQNCCVSVPLDFTLLGTEIWKKSIDFESPCVFADTFMFGYGVTFQHEARNWMKILKHLKSYTIWSIGFIIKMYDLKWDNLRNTWKIPKNDFSAYRAEWTGFAIFVTFLVFFTSWRHF